MTDVRNELRSLDMLEPSDLWQQAQHREPSQLPEPFTSRSHRAVTIIAVLTLAILTTSLAIIALRPDARPGAAGHGAQNPDQGQPVLLGDALAQRLGLVKHPWPPGTRIDSGPNGITASDGQDMSDCQPTGPGDVVLVQEVPDGASSGFYCVHGATQIDAWVLAQKLAGHIPTREEITKHRRELSRG